MTDKWFSMCCAPRDGSFCILLYNDHSGVTLGMWGEASEPEKCLPGEELDAWFEVDGRDEIGGDGSFAGWIPAPAFGKPDIRRASGVAPVETFPNALREVMEHIKGQDGE